MTFDDLFTAFILISLGICVVGFAWLLVKLFRFWKEHGTTVVLTIAALMAGAGWTVWYWWDIIETYAPYVIGVAVVIWFVTSGRAAEVFWKSGGKKRDDSYDLSDAYSQSEINKQLRDGWNQDNRQPWYINHY